MNNPTPRLSPAELAGRIEAAIKLAAKLGADAFDHIEGRGLFYERQEIAAAVEALSKEAERWAKVAQWLSVAELQWADPNDKRQAFALTLSDLRFMVVVNEGEPKPTVQQLIQQLCDDPSAVQDRSFDNPPRLLDAARSPIPGPLNV